MEPDKDVLLFINYYGDSELLSNKRIFAGYILTPHFSNILLKICEILNININLTDITNKLINSKNEFTANIYDDNQYAIRVNRFHTAPFCDTDSKNMSYNHLSTLDYVYIQISPTNWETPLDQRKILKIQKLLNEYLEEPNVCYL